MDNRKIEINTSTHLLWAVVVLVILLFALHFYYQNEIEGLKAKIPGKKKKEEEEIVTNPV